MDREPIFRDLGRSPMTDLRSLGTSILIHAVILILASLVAIGTTAPSGPPPSHVLHAELGPVDNRAPSEAGGGSVGELGGTGSIRALNARSGPRSDAAADALLVGVLPGINPTDLDSGANSSGSTGEGLLPGAGLGGGGGSGGGSGGGTGRGVGPDAEFFGARERAGSFAYVIDCSGSMTNRGALRLAKKELMASLAQLPPDAQFAVIFYNLEPTTLTGTDGKLGLMAATVDNKERVRAKLNTVGADGGTDHVRALESAFALKPEVVFFLTDAEKMAPEDAQRIRDGSGSIRIQAIEFGDGPALPATSDPLRKLALSTGGAFRHVDLSALTPSR